MLKFFNTNKQTFYGGFSINDIYSLDGDEILNNTNLPLHINLLGYIEIINNIKLKDFSNNTITLGSLYDKDYENTFIKGVNSNIHNIYYLNSIILGKFNYTRLQIF